jgi:multicomponent Na+:H+ antiporter subunit G
MSSLVDAFTYIAIATGAFFFLAGTVGLLRFPDTLTRLHALTKADNLGLGLIVLGLLPQVDGVLNGLKLIFIWLLVLLSGADAGQLIARAARRSMRRKAPQRKGHADAAGPLTRTVEPTANAGRQP